MKPKQTVICKPYKWGLRKMHKRNQHLFNQLPAPPSHRMCRLFKHKLERYPNTEKVFINSACTNTTHDRDSLAWQVVVFGDENRKCASFHIYIYISGIYQTRTYIYCFCRRISIWWLNDIIMYMAFNLPYDVITSFPARCLITVNHAKTFLCCRPFPKKTKFISIYTKSHYYNTSE